EPALSDERSKRCRKFVTNGKGQPDQIARKRLKGKMGLARLERATYRLGGGRSIHLSYKPIRIRIDILTARRHRGQRVFVCLSKIQARSQMTARRHCRRASRPV